MTDYDSSTVLADRFEVIGVLGRGGMATVYLANDRVRQIQVALKVLHPHLATDSTMRRRLRREVAAADLVRHDAALVAHELYEVDNTLALSMPFHDGRTLTSMVADQGPLAAEDVRALGQRIASALAQAHRHGVLHHDVTANNVLLNSGSDAVLTDFGIARVHENTATATSIMGTPGYAAPEIYEGERGDPRSDLYSLGVLMYVAATGNNPFGTGNPAGVLRRQMQGEFTPSKTACPDLPDDLAHTIDALLANDPNQRPPSATEVAEALASATSVFVPEVPDTWDLSDVTPDIQGAGQPPTLTNSARNDALVPAQRLQLPDGDFSVVATRGILAAAQPSKLASVVGRVCGLSPDQLEETTALESRKFRLIKGVDEQTARRLADDAEILGYQAKIYDHSPLTPIESAARFFWVPIPIIWVSFGLFSDAFPAAELLIPVCILLTILLSTVVPIVFLRKEAPKGLPLAYGNDLSPHLDPALIATDSPPIVHTSAPTTGQSNAPQPGVVGQANESLDALLLTVDSAELADAARNDLHRTVKGLRNQAAELAAQIRSLTQALDAEPPPADIGWVHQRLTRMDTLVAAGQPADQDERARLLAAIDEHQASDDARQALESRLAAAMAQLLEIATTAQRSRRELLVAGLDSATTGHLVVKRLQREVDAVARARKELAARQRTR